MKSKQERKQQLVRRPRSIATLLVGLALAAAVLVYSVAGGAPSDGWGKSPTATTAAYAAVAKKKETNKQKLAAALKACKKKYKSKSQKSKLKACEKSAKKKYPVSKPKKKTEEKKTEEKKTEEKKTEEPAQKGETEAEELTKAETAVQSPSFGQVEAGEKIFSEECAGCHGPAWGGTENGPNLHEEERAKSIKGVMDQLIHPLSTMPDFRTSLSIEKKEQVADFVTVKITETVQVAH